jgi:hypothetical protein
MIKRRAVVLAATLLASASLYAASPSQSAAQVAVDKNGNLRQPTVIEQRALEAQTQNAHRSLLRLEPKVHAKGMVSIALDESFDHAFVVRTGADGALVFACTTHDEAQEFLAQTASADTILRLKPAGVAKRVAERE